MAGFFPTLLRFLILGFRRSIIRVAVGRAGARPAPGGAAAGARGHCRERAHLCGPPVLHRQPHLLQVLRELGHGAAAGGVCAGEARGHEQSRGMLVALQLAAACCEAMNRAAVCLLLRSSFAPFLSFPLFLQDKVGPKLGREFVCPSLRLLSFARSELFPTFNTLTPP